ncbi:biotin--[acetyl-CoA-carboxylase] ligase [Natrialbaceae archaeon AArc-T1-2]|uniref:biotin--[acetyl-CoA-carboxylase] ligase n=1 Tax=Natrialbaceae archaeon AArc-T1-2 TaxID=3053904 RepID=UPI00255B2CA9|nr:biotin--[acetyl-CoA-carboxylase] ligase [Natrialbaceae archaeon AArc-T1-2]WIV65945.1 biotin--[acetyl-CoA-carboxylase] ligase [Natrialbaceae archaeon AArc-T1-2]
MNETRRRVLEELADGPVTGPEIADALDVSRAAVWKHVEALRDAGFEIESRTDGYELVDVTGYNGPTIEYGLEAPFTIEYHETIASTNDRARELAAEGAEDVVVLANEQTGGRGRLDRRFDSPPGGVWVSIVCRPDIPPVRAPLFTLAGAVAIARAVREVGVDARIKWPNDVVVPVGEDGEYRKLAGILTEMEGEADRVTWLIVGTGINADIASEELPEGATSVRDEVGPFDRRVFVQRLLETFHEYRDLEGVLEDWRDLSLTLGQRVRVELPDGEIEGDAVEIADGGALVVETEDDRVQVSAGDCEHLRPT